MAIAVCSGEGSAVGLLTQIMEVCGGARGEGGGAAGVPIANKGHTGFAFGRA